MSLNLLYILPNGLNHAFLFFFPISVNGDLRNRGLVLPQDNGHSSSSSLDGNEMEEEDRRLLRDTLSKMALPSVRLVILLSKTKKKNDIYLPCLISLFHLYYFSLSLYPSPSVLSLTHSFTLLSFSQVRVRMMR